MDLQLASIVISGISLFVAIFSVRMAWHYKQASERLSANSIFSSQLITVHKCLIDQPELWMTYDDHPLTKTMPTDPSISARIDGYLYMIFNLLSTTYGFYVQYIGEHKLRSDDREYWEAWKYFATELLRNSSKARELFKYPTTQGLYPKRFVAFMNELIHRIEEGSV